jgi:hypothetical protein
MLNRVFKNLKLPLLKRLFLFILTFLKRFILKLIYLSLLLLAISFNKLMQILEYISISIL